MFDRVLNTHLLTIYVNLQHSHTRLSKEISTVSDAFLHHSDEKTWTFKSVKDPCFRHMEEISHLICLKGSFLMGVLVLNELVSWLEFN